MGAVENLKHYTNPVSVRRSTQDMINKTCANWVREPKGNKRHYTNPAFVRQSTQNMTKKKNVCKLGKGAEEKLKHYTNPVSVRRSTQKHDKQNMCKLGKGAEGK